MNTHKDNSIAIMVEEETDDLLADAGLDENSAACVCMMLSMKLSMGATNSQNWSEGGV